MEAPHTPLGSCSTFARAFSWHRLFDLARGQLKGDPRPIAERVVNVLGGIFDVSENGILIYQRGSGTTGKRLTWFDRSGKSLGVTGEVGDYFNVRISPDGQKLASNAGSPNSEIWVDELARAVRMRLTIDPDTDHGSPVWSPDGKRILFGAIQGKARRGIYQKACQRCKRRRTASAV